jgi:hypothetical protein
VLVSELYLAKYVLVQLPSFEVSYLITPGLAISDIRMQNFDFNVRRSNADHDHGGTIESRDLQDVKVGVKLSLMRGVTTNVKKEA